MGNLALPGKGCLDRAIDQGGQRFTFRQSGTFTGMVKVIIPVKVDLARILRATLASLPDTSVPPAQQEAGRTMMTVRSAGQNYRLEAQWAGEGWPSDVRQVLASAQEGPWPRHLVVMARKLSPGALDLLRARDANWVDESGQARIVVPPGLIIVREPPAEATAGPPQEFKWSPSALHVAEVALSEGLTKLRTGELADKTPWSPGQISNVLNAFDSLGWTVRHGGKSGRGTWRELAGPAAMLDSWAARVGSENRHKRLAHRAARDLLRFAETELREALGWEAETWALTTWAGLEVIAPFVTVVPVVHVYVTAERLVTELDEVLRKAALREVEEGARVEFWEADFPLITQPGQPSRIPVASTPRLYADLLALGGRGADAAQHLREIKLGF